MNYEKIKIDESDREEFNEEVVDNEDRAQDESFALKSLDDEEFEMPAVCH